MALMSFVSFARQLRRKGDLAFRTNSAEDINRFVNVIGGALCGEAAKEACQLVVIIITRVTADTDASSSLNCADRQAPVDKLHLKDNSKSKLWSRAPKVIRDITAKTARCLSQCWIDPHEISPRAIFPLEVEDKNQNCFSQIRLIVFNDELPHKLLFNIAL